VSQKTSPAFFDFYLKTNYQILITFWYEYFRPNLPSNDHSVSHLTQRLFLHYLGKTTSEISLFYPMRYDCLIHVTRNNTVWSHFWHYGWHFIQLSIFQLPAVKLFEVLAHYANAGKETLSTAVWIMFCFSSVPVASYRPAVGAHKLEQMEFIDVLFIHFNTYYAWSAFPR